MDTEEGYDVEVLQDCSQDLYCVICMKLLRNPVQFKCGHGMCHGCLKNLLQRNRRSTAQCPQCREIVKENQVVSNVMLHRFILSLKVRCVNDEYGCNWTGQLDMMEEHYQQCMAHTKGCVSQGTNKSTRKKKGRKPVMTSSAASPSIESDLLLEITGQLSALHNKVEQLEGDKNNAMSSALTTTTTTTTNSHHPVQQVDNNHGVLSSMCRNVLRKIVSNPFFLILHVVLMMLLVLWISLISFRLLLMTSSEGMEGMTFAPLDLNNLQTAFSQLHTDLSKIHSQIYAQQNNFFQLHLVSKELRMDFNAQKVIFQNYLALYWQSVFYDFRYRQSVITDEIEFVFANQIKTIGDIEKKFDFEVERLHKEIGRHNKTLIETALKLVTVVNSTHLPVFDYIDKINTLERKISQLLDYEESIAESTVKQVFELANKKYSNLKRHFERFGRFNESTPFHRLYEEYQETNVEAVYKLSVENLKKHIERLHRNYFVLRDSYKDDLNDLRNKFPHTMFAYETRFKHAMTQMENVDFKNGKFVWMMDSTRFPSLPIKHGYYSNEFTAIPAATSYEPSKFAKLWLLRMSSENTFWKVTYEQEADADVKVDISLLNQRHDEDLNCVEIYRKLHDNKLQLIIDFKIPLNLQQLEERGFIHGHKIYIRAIVRKQRPDSSSLH